MALRPRLTLLFDVVLLLGLLGFVVGDAADDRGLGGRPAPQQDPPLQGPLRPQRLGRREGPRLQQLDGVDLLGRGFLPQKALLVPLLGGTRGDTGRSGHGPGAGGPGGASWDPGWLQALASEDAPHLQTGGRPHSRSVVEALGGCGPRTCLYPHTAPPGGAGPRSAPGWRGWVPEVSVSRQTYACPSGCPLLTGEVTVLRGAGDTGCGGDTAGSSYRGPAGPFPRRLTLRQWGRRTPPTPCRRGGSGCGAVWVRPVAQSHGQRAARLPAALCCLSPAGSPSAHSRDHRTSSRATRGLVDTLWSTGPWPGQRPADLRTLSPWKGPPRRPTRPRLARMPRGPRGRARGPLCCWSRLSFPGGKPWGQL